MECYNSRWTQSWRKRKRKLVLVQESIIFLKHHEANTSQDNFEKEGWQETQRCLHWSHSYQSIQSDDTASNLNHNRQIRIGSKDAFKYANEWFDLCRITSLKRQVRTRWENSRILATTIDESRTKITNSRRWMVSGVELPEWWDRSYLRFLPANSRSLHHRAKHDERRVDQWFRAYK